MIIMISLIDVGKVGACAAFEILRYRISDVNLIDIAEDLARGEALDIMQTVPAIEFDGKIGNKRLQPDAR
jgi:malate/lactate dehydrogenase